MLQFIASRVNTLLNLALSPPRRCFEQWRLGVGGIPGVIMTCSANVNHFPISGIPLTMFTTSHLISPYKLLFWQALLVLRTVS